jgi:hypothetical protein
MFQPYRAIIKGLCAKHELRHRFKFYSALQFRIPVSFQSFLILSDHRKYQRKLNTYLFYSYLENIKK